MLTFRARFLGVALLTATAALAQNTVLPFLPKETMVAVSVPDLGTSIREFADMPLAKMWAEKEVQTFVADLRAMVKKQLDKGMEQAKAMHDAGQLPIDPEKLLALRINGGTLAITQLSLAVGENGPMPKVGALIHLDFGDTAEQWFDLVRMGLGMLEKQAGDKMVREEAKVGDVTLITLKPQVKQAGEMGLNLAMLKTGLVIGTLKSDVQALVENLAGKTPQLGGTELYKNTAKHLLANGAECETFIRPSPLLDFGLQVLGMAAKHSSDMEWLDVDGVGRAVEALGLRSVEATGSTSTYQNGKAVTKGYTVAPAPSRKGLLAGGNKQLDMGFLKWVPKDAVSFSGMTFDAMSFYDGMVGALRAYDPKVAEHMLGQLHEAETKLGFTIRDDLFGSMGDTFLSWSMPMSTITAAPEMALLLKVTNQEKVVKVLKSLAALTDGKVEIEEGEKRGVMAYQLHINWDPTGGMGTNPLDAISPTFAFKNGYLVAGFSPSDIKRVFSRMDREDDPKNDIRGNKEYAVVADALPKQVGSVSFTDWKANFESLYQMATGLLAFLPMGEDVPVDMSLLPESGTLTKHLFGALSYSTVDAGGIESSSVGPFGPEIVLGVAVAAGAAAAMVGHMR